MSAMRSMSARRDIPLRRLALGAALALGLFAVSASAFSDTAAAAGSDDEVFAQGSFEASAGLEPSASAEPSSGAARTEYLLGGSAALSSLAYFVPGESGYAASSGASGKVFAKVSVPDYGQLYASATYSQAFLRALSGDGPKALAPSASLSSPSLGLSELHYSFDLGKRAFFRLGKQLLAWGPSLVWSPEDFVNLQKADSFASLDLRQGKSGLKLFVPLGSADLTAFADFSALVDSAGKVLDPADAMKYAARAAAALGGFELGLSGAWSPGSQAKGGFDFSGRLFGGRAYGELAAGPAYSDYGAFAQASLGYSHTLGELKRWTLSMEGFYNSLGSDIEGSALAAGFASGSAVPLYVGTWYGYLSVKAQELFADWLDMSASALANFSDGSYKLSLGPELSIPGAPKFSLSLGFYGGGEGKELTMVPGDKAFEIGLATAFSF